MKVYKANLSALGIIVVVLTLLLEGCAYQATRPTLKLSVPQQIGYVNDFSSIFPQQAREKIENKLLDYEKETKRTVLFVSLPVLDCVFLEEECTYAVYRAWGVEKNHSAILFVSGVNRRERTFLGLGKNLTIDDVAYYKFIQNTV